MKRSDEAINRRRSGWQMASFAALILALGSGSGCKDDNGGKAPIDDDSGTEEGDASTSGTDGGDAATPGPDSGDAGTSELDASADSSADAQVDADAPDTAVTNDAGSDAGDAGNTGGNGLTTTTSIEFGLSPCGGAAPAGKVFALNNTGSTAINYTVTLSSTTAFSIQGETGTKSGTIEPGGTASLTINAAAIPGTATAGQDLTAALTVTSNLPAPYNSFVVPVSIKPQGAHLAYGTGGAPAWPLAASGEAAAEKNVILVNSGNAAAAITVTQPDVDVFGLAYNGAPAGALTVPAAGDATLVASFEPVVNAPYTDEAPIAVAGAVCNGGAAASLTSITLQGEGTGDALTFDITDAFETRVNCGAATGDLPKATIAVTNRASVAVVVELGTLAGPTASPFALSAPTLSLAAGATGSFDVTLLASEVPSSATPGTEISDTLVAGVQGSSNPPALHRLSTTVQGAVLVVTTPPTFTNTTQSTQVTQQVEVTNTGNLPVSPAFSIGGTNASLFAVTLPPSAIPVGSAPTSVGVTFTPPVGDSTAKSATLIVTPRPGLDVVCDPAPSPTVLAGQASTSGFQPLTASPVNFTLDCPTPGATPGQLFGASNETVSFVNSGNAGMKWTAALDNAGFAISIGGMPIGSEEHVLAMGAQADIRVDAVDVSFPASTTTDGYSATLTVTTDVPGDNPHTFKLARTARGAIIKSANVIASFPNQNVQSESDLETLFTLTNSGNVAASLALDSVLTGTYGNAAHFVGSDFATVSHPASQTITLAADNTPVSVDGFFDPVYPPGDFSAYDEILDLVTPTVQTTFSTSERLCDVLPSRIDIAGTGTNAVTGVSVTSIDFSASPADRQTCGGLRAARPKTIVITNYGNQVLHIDSLTLDDPSGFSVYVNSPGLAEADVPAWDPVAGRPGSAVVVISPNRIMDTSSGTHTATASLTIATSIGGVPGNAIAPIPLANSVVCP